MKLKDLLPDGENKEMDNDPCWDDYEMVGTKKKNGKTVPNCVPVAESYCPACLIEYINGKHPKLLGEATDGNGKVKLGKPFRTPDGPKKFSVYVKNDKGNVVKVNFGDPDMEIKRDDPERRKSFRARHNCDSKTDRTSAGYWSCKFWEKGKTVSSMTEAMVKYAEFEVRGAKGKYIGTFYTDISVSIYNIKAYASSLTPNGYAEKNNWVHYSAPDIRGTSEPKGKYIKPSVINKAADDAYKAAREVGRKRLANAHPLVKKRSGLFEVRVDTTAYRFSHGKEPRGYSGMWMFTINDKDYSFSGNYSDAKKQAIKKAKELGAYSIKTLP